MVMNKIHRRGGVQKSGMGPALRLGQTLEVAALEITHLGSCHLGKYPWEVAP